MIEEFPDRLVFASGTTRPSLGKFVSFSTAKDYSFDEATGINFRVFSDVTVQVAQILDSGIRP